MDRNQYIGFGLLAALVVVYVVYTSNEQKQFAEQKRKQYIADSIASAANKPILIADTSKKTGLVAATPADTNSDFSEQKSFIAIHYQRCLPC